MFVAPKPTVAFGGTSLVATSSWYVPFYSSHPETVFFAILRILRFYVFAVFGDVLCLLFGVGGWGGWGWGV